MSALLESITFRCARCREELCADLAAAGSIVSCEHCRHLQVVPDAEPKLHEDVAETSYAALKARIIQEDVALRSDPQRMKAEWNPIAKTFNPRAIVPASLWKRFFGSMIDGFLGLIAAAIGVALVFGMLQLKLVESSALKAEGFNMEKFNAHAAVAFPILLLAIIQWNLITLRGQSIGKIVLCMKIINDQGNIPGFLYGVVVRNWLCNALCIIPLFSLLDCLTIFGASHRCIHDFMAGTHVVDVD